METSNWLFSDTSSLVWKLFAENKLNLEDLKERQPIHGENVIVTGYPKADAFEGLVKTKHKRKKVIIAPHHSIHGIGLQGQFLKFSDLYLSLPQKYPQIDFIFRPHPLLYYTLIQDKYWGEEKTKEYYQKMDSFENCVYDTSSNYYQTFVDSDGIIHDCGGFLPEYFYTENPTCYTLRDEKAIGEYFNFFGKCCLDFCYKAYDKKDIINYIDNVVLKGDDYLKQKRKKFSETVVKFNYPKASIVIMDYIKKQIIINNKNI